MPERAHKVFRILTLNQISPLGLKLFDASHYVVSGDIAEPDAILVRSHNMLQMEIPASVKAIGRAGAGTNNVPVKEMNLRGVPVFNAPGANANAVKELVLAGMVSSRSEGRFVIYTANFDAINELVIFLTENCCGGQPCIEATNSKPKPVKRKR